MILSYRCKHTEALLASGVCHRDWQSFARIARRKLLLIDPAQSLHDLKVPPGNTRSGSTTNIACVSSGGLVTLTTSKSSTTTKTGDRVMRADMVIHPGEVLREDFMLPHKLSANRLAGALGVPANRITAILNGTRGISGETALLLGKVFGTTPAFWMNLQIRYELDLAVSQTATTRLAAAEAFGRTLAQ